MPSVDDSAQPGLGQGPRQARDFIEFDRLALTYVSASGPVEAVRDITASISEGEFVCIVGPSGCGKSTLLRMAAGLRRPTSGTVRVAHTPVTGPIKSAGMVFQAPILMQWRNVLDNILIGAELGNLPPRRYLDRAHALIELTGLKGFADKFPRELSGGMQQRVALCRALLLDPAILLMDEPFGALDAMTRDDMTLELLRIWETTRKTVIFVTHSIPEAVFLADRVIVMSARPGRVAKVYDIPLARPRTVALRAQPEFGQLCVDIYNTLKVGEPGSAQFL